MSIIKVSRATSIEKGVALLTAFSPSQRAMIYEACSVRGSAIEADVAAHAAGNVLNVAPLDFLRAEALSVDDITGLLVGLKAILKDALMADWTVDQYAQAITRAVKVPSDLANTMAKNVVTEDTNATGFARSIASWIPQIPLLPFDDVARGAVKVAATMWDALIPKDLKSKAMDSAYEWLLLGRAIQQLAVRQSLTDAEDQFEQEATAVAASNPALIPSLMSIADALKSAGSAFGSSESGDVEAGDVLEPYSDVVRDAVDVFKRAETGDLDEHEIGALGKRVGNFFKRAAGTVAGGLVGGPVGASIGGSVAGKIGRRKHAVHPTIKQMAKKADEQGIKAKSMTYEQVAGLLKEVAKT